MAKQLVQRDLMSLALGGAFFGSGGGGTIVSAQHLATQFVRGDYYPVDTVEVVSVEEASGPDAKGEAVMVAYLGAPEAINSALYPTGPELAVRNVRDRLASEGRKLAYIVPPESGALGFVVG